MGKRKEPKDAAISDHGSGAMTYDPRVSNLFMSSLGPTRPVSQTTAHTLPQDETEKNSVVSVDNTACNTITLKQTPDRSERPKSDVSSIGNPTLSAIARGVHPASQTKRKRKKDGDDIEGIYMQRIADEELRDARQRATEDLNKRRKISSMSELSDKGTDTGDDGPEASAGEATRGEANGHSYTELPQHESLTSSREKTELEKAVRTVFLGNVPTLCIKSKAARKALLGHLTSFCPSIPATDTPHKIESLRFRSTPFASGVGPKKAAYAKKELMDATTKCTNAYVVYSTSLAAREAVKRLNGTVVLDRHLLVDSVAHPRKTDHRRCVFVGNLGFVDDESQINAAKAEHEDRNPKKSRAPADVEEGLWRQFSKGGQVESVRVVRDASTRVGKGFAYVQYQNENAVEKALLYNDKKFPPLLPRTLRVTRAKKMTKAAGHKSQRSDKVGGGAPSIAMAKYAPKADPRAQSMSGRAGKLFGRAGAAHVNSKRLGNIPKSPEQTVFEGYRASNSKQSKGTKVGDSGKKQGKPRTRSSRRGAAFKAKAGK